MKADLTRRKLLHGAAGVAGVGLAGGAVGAAPRRRDLIRAENQKPGTTDWRLTNTRIDPKTNFRCPWIEGYCSHTSIRAGETLEIMVSTNPPSPFVVDVYRMGYYGGKGGRRMARLGPFKGTVQPDPDVGDEDVRECQWEPGAHIKIPRSWPSGVYLGKLTAEKEGLQSYVIFIVRDDRPCDFLYQCSDATWSAYNRWPDRFSLYHKNGKDWWGPDVRVSWDRPYGRCGHLFAAPYAVGSGEFLLWEMPMVFWLEKEGYDVSYISNVDTHADGAGLRRAKGFLSVGHDEYWSLDMFHNVKGAVSAGVNAGFFCGNSCYGMVDFFTNRHGRPDRAINRMGVFGPPEQETFKKSPEMLGLKSNGPNEAELMGARTTRPIIGEADWTCANGAHWLFEGTGMKTGDGIPHLVGWEFHGNPAPIPGLEIVGQGIAQGRKGATGTYTATIYPGPKGNLVFNAATIWWSDGLSAPPGYQHPVNDGPGPKGPDPRVQRITANLLGRFRG